MTALAQALENAALEAEAASHCLGIEPMEKVRLGSLAGVLRAEARVAQQKGEPRLVTVAGRFQYA